MNTKSKIVAVEQLKRLLSKFRRQGKKIAFTNGCFDLLHYGHVSYLEKAKRGDRILVVGLNSDSSVRCLKGPSRPINNEKVRAAVLAALACVDFVVIFREETPARLIERLMPDILIKGADWKGKEVAGASIVKAAGGKVELIDYVDNFSTTKIIDSINAQCTK